MADNSRIRSELGIEEESIPSTIEELQRTMEAQDESSDEETLAPRATYDRQQVIEAARLDLNFLAGITMPDVFTCMFPKVHLAIWQFLVNAESGENQFPQLAVGIPRGHAKTTLVKLFIVWCILFTKKQFILVTSDTATKAQEIISDVIDMLDQENVRAIFGNWREGIETDNKEVKKFGYRKRNIVLAAIGSGGSVRGLNIKNRRPDVIIFDDVQSRECADSKQQSEILERWMIGTAMKAKSQSGCMFIFLGNMYPTPYSILKKLKDNPTWVKFISGAILADGSAIWEEYRSLKSLIEEFDSDLASGHPEIFFSEVLNDTEAGQNTSVDFSRFIDWPWMDHDIPQGKFIIIDPSQGKGLDADCIAYFEIYDEKIGVRQIIEEHLSPGNLIRRALMLALTTGTKFIAVEAMAYQFTLLYWFEEICKAIGIEGITFMPIYQQQHSKNSRINMGLKSMESGDVVLHPSVRSYVQKQIADWKPLKRDNKDDALDVIAYSTKVLADYPFEIGTPSNENILKDEGAQVVENNHMF